MSKHRKIYLKLLKELDEAKDHLDKINMRIHEMLDLFDEDEAANIQQDHQMWMNDDDIKD